MRFAYTLPALLLLAAVAPAQTPEVVAKVDAKLDAERAAQRNEDVEILRRLLNRSLGMDGTVSVLPDSTQAYVSSTALLPNLQSNPNGGVHLPTLDVSASLTAPPQGKRVSQVVGPFDGVYLGGAGVVYTLRVPAGVDLTFDPKTQAVGLNGTCTACHTGITVGDAHPHTRSGTNSACTTCHDAGSVSASAAVTPSLSEWERMRMELRGEKPPAPEPKKGDKSRKTLCGPGSLTELLTAQLFAHARNVRHLGEAEAVTLVVTFDELPGAKGSSATAEPTGKPGFTPDELKQITLGDLHLKQGKYAEAVAAYADGLARFTNKEWRLDGLTKMTPEQRNRYADELQKGVRDAMKAYAKALTLADLPERAKQALTLATEFVVLEVTPTTAKPAGPAKLILRVAKADVEAPRQFAPGVMSEEKYREAFKKAVRVERVNFPEVK